MRFQGRYVPEARAIAAPLLSDDACEATRAARTLARLSTNARRQKRSAYVRAHCAALLASMQGQG
jgi:hypothetical protein